MNYRIKRGDQEFGPYTLAELQHYVQTLHISREDLAISDGMTEWIPVSQVLGDIPIPPAYQPGVAGATDANLMLAPQLVPLPPNLPWPVLLVSYLSLLPFTLFKLISFFTIVWGFIQANWARKLSGKNTALVLMAMNVAGLFSGGFLAGFGAALHTSALAGFGGLLILAGAVCHIFANFSIRDAMEEYYNTVEVIGIGLSGVMVFFFGAIYIQYHINRIARWKQTGELS
jgi:GYF domain 2